MTDTETSEGFDFEAHRQYLDMQKTMLVSRIAKVIREFPAKGSIEFLELPVIDDFNTMTVGSWGGYLVQIMPMIFNDRIVLTPASSPYGYDHGWCYDKGAAAILALLTWSPDTQGEPEGYKKRATAGVRQPGEMARDDDEVPYWLERVAERWGNV